MVRISSSLAEEEIEDLVRFLRENFDIFAWSTAYMPSVGPQVIFHRLNVSPDVKPVTQKRRRFAPQAVKAIRQEVRNLLSAGFIKEVVYLDCILNVVMLKMANGECILILVILTRLALRIVFLCPQLIDW